MDMRWLELRGRTWYCVKDAPRHLRPTLGKRLLRSLQTRDVNVARARRHAILADFQRTIAAAERDHGPANASPAYEAGMAWRGIFAALERGDPGQIKAFAAGGGRIEWQANGEPVQLDDHTAARDNAESLLSDQVDRFGEQHGHAAAQTLIGLARGTATPLQHHVDAWLAEGGPKGPTNARTQGQYRSDLAGLGAWMTRAGIAPTIEAVTKAVAGRYVTEGLIGAGVNRLTANRKISTASSYWTWLGKRTAIEANPWRGQSLAKGAANRSGEQRKRAFTEAEAATLLAGGADDELADAMRVAALTGMRLEEIYRLTVVDCADGWFRIRVAKTQAGTRRVPIHSALVPVVARRVAAKEAGAFLFPEPGEAKPGRERSMAASKRFGHYRKRLGVDATVEGQRQSAIDFHSWRRRFVSMARDAGVDRATVAAVVGHEAGNVTDDVYRSGPAVALMRACVEAVTLPDSPPQAAVAGP